MPEPVSQLEEQLKALVRFSAPGEFRKALHNHEIAKVRGPAKLADVAPAAAAPQNWRAAGRRPRQPRSGGIIPPRDLKTSWAVNIRPKLWGNKDKIWWGRIESKEKARKIADIIYHYIGCGSVHNQYPDTDPPPPFLNANLARFNNREKRMEYVVQIAKGENNRALRREFSDGVKQMVQHLTTTYAARHEIAPEFPSSATFNVPSPSELGEEGFEEYYGNLSPVIPILSPVIPILSQDDLDLLMKIAAG